MTLLLSPVLAEESSLILGQPWYAWFAILIGIAAVLFGVAAIGRWLTSLPGNKQPTPAVAASAPTAPAATPVPAALVAEAPAQPKPIVNTTLSNDVFAAIAAAVVVTLGSRARIAAINPLLASDKPAIDTSRLQWSMEGRRQIYSSHKVR